MAADSGVTSLLAELVGACQAPVHTKWTKPFDALLFGHHSALRGTAARSPEAELVDAAYDLRCVAGESQRAEMLEACGARLLSLGGAAVSTMRCLLALRAATPNRVLESRVYSSSSPEQLTGGPVFQHFSSALFASQPLSSPGTANELVQLMSLLDQSPRFKVVEAGDSKSLQPLSTADTAGALDTADTADSPKTSSDSATTSGALQLEYARLVRRSMCWETANRRAIQVRESLSPTVRGDQCVSTVSQASHPRSKELRSPPLSFSKEGAAAFNRACNVLDLQFEHLDQTDAHTPGVSLDQLDLVRACTAVLQGFRSSLFAFNEAQRRFTWNGESAGPPSMCSRRALRVAVQQVANTGTCCARVEHLARVLGDEEHAQGLVRRQLGRTLGAYLQHVRAWLLDGERVAHPTRTDTPVTLTSLMRRTRVMRAQMSQVCALCGWPIEDDTPSLPNGMQLLNRLYGAATDCAASPQQQGTSGPAEWSQVVNVLFSEAVQPFMRFADAWLQHGVVEDPFNEFADRAFVEEAEALLDLGFPHRNSPAFLTLQAWNQMLRCGATVRLVHRYDPSHYICQCPAPALGTGTTLSTDIHTDPDSLSTNTWSWTQFCEDRRRLWVDMLQTQAEKRTLQKQKDLASQSQQMVSEIARAVRGAAEDAAATNVAIAEHSRQQRLLYAEELRQQIVADRRRPDTTAENEDMSNEDSVFSTEDIHMVAQMIEQEYEDKIGLVEARLAHISWQQRRMQLQQARLQFWRQEAEAERKMLIAHSQASHSQASLNPDSVSDQVKHRQKASQQPEEPVNANSSDEESSLSTADDDISNTLIAAPHIEEESESSEAPSSSQELLGDVDSPELSSHETRSGDTKASEGLRIDVYEDTPSAEDMHMPETDEEIVAKSEETEMNTITSVPEMRSVWHPKDSGRVEVQPRQVHSHGIICSVWSSSSLPPNVPLNVMTQRCLQAAIAEQDLHAQSAAVQIFLHRTELDLVQHLRNLHNFCLTGSPDFAAALSRSIFSGVQSASRQWITTQNCTAALSSAFAACDTGDHVASLFTLNVVGKRPFQISENDDHDLAALEACGVQMVYAPANSWPLDSVLDSKSMEDYNTLWRMLMQLHRILDAGRLLWSLLKDMTRVHGNFTVGQLNRLSLIRHQVQHFINVLRDYLKAQVLHMQWARVECELNEAQVVGKIQEVHRRYLDRLLSGCLLRHSSAGVLKVITSMFDLVLTFCAQLVAAERCHRSSEDEVAARRSFQEMTRTGQLFHKHEEFLGRLLRKQVEAAPSPTLRLQAEELLQRLEV